MSCIHCVDNINRPGAPEYGRQLRASANKGCSCGCGGNVAEATPPYLASTPLGKTVSRQTRRWERPTAEPQVTLLVN